eukprot:TRINITY_DN34491_c1_g1_i1.p6 TRINITY_DN34491_c1_g1~~TRINITY_DN34491_c1_g1_i1.p6  ORF type:complete len:105 (+),score=4.57 TRINITY_DN34491_c1_g1_i1:193-507(+)
MKLVSLNANEYSVRRIYHGLEKRNPKVKGKLQINRPGEAILNDDGIVYKPLAKYLYAIICDGKFIDVFPASNKIELYLIILVNLNGIAASATQNILLRKQQERK